MEPRVNDRAVLETLIVTEAGPGIGLGHLMRCRRLAEGLAERGVQADLVLFGKNIPEEPVSFRSIETLPFDDARPTVQDVDSAIRHRCGRHDYRWLVLDGEGVRRSRFSGGLSTLLIDDDAHEPLAGTAVLNQNTEDRAIYSDAGTGTLDTDTPIATITQRIRNHTEFVTDLSIETFPVQLAVRGMKDLQQGDLSPVYVVPAPRQVQAPIVVDE